MPLLIVYWLIRFIQLPQTFCRFCNTNSTHCVRAKRCPKSIQRTNYRLHGSQFCISLNRSPKKGLFRRGVGLSLPNLNLCIGCCLCIRTLANGVLCIGEYREVGKLFLIECFHKGIDGPIPLGAERSCNPTNTEPRHTFDHLPSMWLLY